MFLQAELEVFAWNGEVKSFRDKRNGGLCPARRQPLHSGGNFRVLAFIFEQQVLVVQFKGNFLCLTSLKPSRINNLQCPHELCSCAERANPSPFFRWSSLPGQCIFFSQLFVPFTLQDTSWGGCCGRAPRFGAPLWGAKGAVLCCEHVLDP